MANETYGTATVWNDVGNRIEPNCKCNSNKCYAVK